MAAGLAVAPLGVVTRAQSTTPAAAPPLPSRSRTEVRKVERIFVDVPFKPVPAKHQFREFDHEARRFNQLLKVHLANGVVGVGEGAVARGAVQRVTGRNAAELMWDDTLGSGLQIALFDAVARANDIPVHRLLGTKVRDRAFLSWWAKDMPGEDWVLECKEAIARGYTAFKGKARPWFDLIEQCKTVTPALPRHFEIDFDFNALLLDSGHAAPYLAELQQFPNMAIFESPIPQGDVEGNKILRQGLRIPIAMHYGTPPIMTALREEVCDGFVVGGGASRVLEQGAILAAANKPFWLQLTGFGVTAVWTMHLAAVLTHARWPAITLHHMFVSELVTPQIQLENGSAQIPDGPGLGFALDDGAVEKYRIERIPDRPQPNRLYAIRWPSGGTSYYRNADEFRADFIAGKLPVFARGVSMEEVTDDGSSDWKDLHSRAQQGGVHVGARPKG
jgi:galactonate dehydratase